MIKLTSFKFLVLPLFLLSVLLVNQATAYTFPRNLKLGDRGEDVRQLQVILNQSQDTKVAISGAGSPGQETDYFGQATLGGVKRFQNKYQNEVLLPAGLSAPTGFVGALTRAKMASLSDISALGRIITNPSSNTSPSGSVTAPVPPQLPTGMITAKKPLITAISPTRATAGTIITITGEGFLPTGNTVYTGYDRQTVNSADGKTITFVFNPPFASGVQAGGHVQFGGVPFHFYVSNINGTSGESPEFTLIF